MNLVLRRETDNTVLELLDRVLNTGVVLVGDITITVADIELDLPPLAVDAQFRRDRPARRDGSAIGPHFDKPQSVSYAKLRADRKEVPWRSGTRFFRTMTSRRCCGATAAAPIRSRLPSRIRIDPENVRNGLVQLVLTLIELLRELLERQALRRIDGGSLTAEEIERLGLTFLRLSEEMDRLKQQFGLTDDDLNLDLGPLGKLR